MDDGGDYEGEWCIDVAGHIPGSVSDEGGERKVGGETCAGGMANILEGSPPDDEGDMKVAPARKDKSRRCMSFRLRTSDQQPKTWTVACAAPSGP